MQTFILLTRVSPAAVPTPQALEALEKKANEHIQMDCPEVKWIANYALLGPYDYLDVFTAPDVATAARVSAIVRSYGRAHSEIWPATPWREFKEMLHGMTQAAKGEPAETHPEWERTL